jgi:hypothetical protein
VVANGGAAVDEATLRTQIATCRSWLQQEDEFEGVLELRTESSWSDLDGEKESVHVRSM